MNRHTLGRTGLSVSEIGSQWNARWSGCAPTGSTSSTVQIVYNLARREAEDTFLPTAQAANVGVIAREASAIVGMTTVRQVEENLNAGM